MTELLKIFASAALKVFADAALGWLRDRQTTRDEQALGASRLEAATYADAATRADQIGQIAAAQPDHGAVIDSVRDGTF